MTAAQFNLWGTTLKSVGVSLIGGGLVALPTGLPMWATPAISGAGVVLQIIGTVFSHMADGLRAEAVNTVVSQQAATVAPVATGAAPPQPPVA